MLKSDVNRREFLKVTAGASTALAMPTSGHTTASNELIGIQVGAVSFVDEATERVLDMLQERAYVNTLFLAVFTYSSRHCRKTNPRPVAARSRVARLL